MSALVSVPAKKKKNFYKKKLLKPLSREQQNIFHDILLVPVSAVVSVVVWALASNVPNEYDMNNETFVCFLKK